MYPAGELAHLAARREYLQARIALRRETTIVALHRLTRPIATVDRALGHWRRLRPALKILGPVAALFLGRKLSRGGRWQQWFTLAGGLPGVIRAARAYMSHRRAAVVED